MTAETMKRPFSLTSQETTPGALAACAIGTRPKVASTYAPAGGNVSQNSSWHAQGTVKPTSGFRERVS